MMTRALYQLQKDCKICCGVIISHCDNTFFRDKFDMYKVYTNTESKKKKKKKKKEREREKKKQ